MHIEDRDFIEDKEAEFVTKDIRHITKRLLAFLLKIFLIKTEDRTMSKRLMSVRAQIRSFAGGRLELIFFIFQS